MKRLVAAIGIAALTGCGSAYISPSVSQSDADVMVRVIPLTAQSVEMANRETSYQPRQLPPAFSTTAGFGPGLRQGMAIPAPPVEPTSRPAAPRLILPPAIADTPYEIGIGDVVVLATKQAGSTVEELTGLLAAQNRRQGYTVQDDGAIAIPEVGRINIAGLSIEEAEAVLFQRLVENQIDPSFSLEVSEFNSHRASIGGAIRTPAVLPITLTPLYLEEAIAAAGGIDAANTDEVLIRIYRDGQLYQVPYDALYSNGGLSPIRIVDGDSIFIDTTYELDQAERYFEQQIRVAQLRQESRQQALAELQTQVALRRGELQEQRDTFQSRAELGAVERDYVYMFGEVGNQGRYPLPFDTRATLADALFESDGIMPETGNPSQIYLLRASVNPQEFGSTTAWHLDASNVVNLTLATRMELRPNDIIFVAEQPVTRWNRVVQQLVPSLITSGVAAATN